jgi:hypothetical protein
MSAVRKNVSLHPQTVTKVSQNAIAISPAKKRKPSRKANSKVVVSHWYDGIDPLLVAWVRKNKIHWRRIEVVNSTTIIVHHPKH